MGSVTSSRSGSGLGFGYTLDRDKVNHPSPTVWLVLVNLPKVQHATDVQWPAIKPLQFLGRWINRWFDGLSHLTRYCICVIAKLVLALACIYLNVAWNNRTPFFYPWLHAKEVQITHT